MHEETKELIRRAKTGDSLAGDELIRKNRGLIYSAATRFCGRGTEAEDLFQIGAIGFIKAVRRFDESYEVELSTYAVPMIIGEIKRFLRDDGIIKVSRRAKEAAYKIRKIQSEKSDIHLSDVARMLGITYEEALYALEATSLPESIDRPLDQDGGKNAIDIMPSGENVEEEVIKRLELRCAIEKLEKLDREIIFLRYYREMTQTKTAKILGLTQVQVSRREKKIMSELKKTLASDKVDIAN